MKRLLTWILVVLLALSAMPMMAQSSATFSYDMDDIDAALSGMGRMPKDYCTLAGIMIEAGVGSASAAQAETLTKKLYSFWAFMSGLSYQIDDDQPLSEVMTEAQWSAVTSYISGLAYRYGKYGLFTVFMNFLGSATTGKLNAVPAPEGLLGVCFDPATVGQSSTVKIYTTTAIPSVDVANASGVSLVAQSEAMPPYVGNLGTFVEHRVVLQPFTAAGKQNVQVRVGGTSQYRYVTFALDVNPASSSGTAQKGGAATVKKVSSDKADLGQPSKITVQTSAATEYVKITTTGNATLAFSSTPVSSSGTTKVFELYYAFPKTGANSIRAYAGMGDPIVWNSTYKAASVTVNAPASRATISKISATKVYRGQIATVTVYASSSTERVMMTDSAGVLFDYEDEYTQSGSYRVFSLEFTSTVAKTHRIYLYAGDGLAWNTSRKTASITVAAPGVKSVSAPSVPRNTYATITVIPTSTTATQARLLSTNKSTATELGTAVLVDGKFVFSEVFTQSKAGTKKVYVQVSDGYGWSAYATVNVKFK